LAAESLSANQIYEILTQSAATDRESIGDALRANLGDDALRNGIAPLVDELTVVWAIAAPNLSRPPRVVSEVGLSYQQLLERLGASDLYALAATFPEGTAMRWHYDVEGEKRGGGALEVFRTPPDGREQSDVPKGAVIPQPRWRSDVFPGTIRDWSIYVPAQYRPDQPAAVMVFQDGVRTYQALVPTVFDNLIARGDMPVTLGIFIDPGTFADTTVSNRSFEYDTLSDQYTRFLLEEILPEVEKTYRLRGDAAGRAICGISSGGICAFTVAWQRPEQFSKVLSWVGSFTNIASGRPSAREVTTIRP